MFKQLFKYETVENGEGRLDFGGYCWLQMALILTWGAFGMIVHYHFKDISAPYGLSTAS